MKVKSKTEAWKLARQMFSQDFEYSNLSSAGSGYPIYKPTVQTEDNLYDQIADLNSRIEVIVNGEVFNIDIEEEPIKKEAKLLDVDIKINNKEQVIHYNAFNVTSFDNYIVISYVGEHGKGEIIKYNISDITLIVTSK